MSSMSHGNVRIKNLYLIQTSDEETAKKNFEGFQGRNVHSDVIVQREIEVNVDRVLVDDSESFFIFEDRDVYGFRFRNNKPILIMFSVTDQDSFWNSTHREEYYFPQESIEALKSKLATLFHDKIKALKGTPEVITPPRREQIYFVVPKAFDQSRFEAYGLQGNYKDIPYGDILDVPIRPLLNGLLNLGNNVHFVFENKMSYSLKRVGDRYQELILSYPGSHSRSYLETVSDVSLYNPPLETIEQTIEHFIAMIVHNAKQLRDAQEPLHRPKDPNMDYLAQHLADSGVVIDHDNDCEHITVDLTKLPVENITTQMVAIWLQRVARVEFKDSNEGVFIIQETNVARWKAHAHHHSNVREEDEADADAGIMVSHIFDGMVTSQFFEEDDFVVAVTKLLKEMK